MQKTCSVDCKGDWAMTCFSATPDSDTHSVWKSLWAKCSGTMLLSNTFEGCVCLSSVKCQLHMSLSQCIACFSDMVEFWGWGGPFFNNDGNMNLFFFNLHFLHYKAVLRELQFISIINWKAAGWTSTFPQLGVGPTNSLNKEASSHNYFHLKIKHSYR